MVDPVSATLAVVGTGASIAGGVTSAIGAKYAGDAKGNMYDYQAGVAKLNEQIEQQNADYSRKTGEVQASISGQRTAQTVGLIKANQSASGVDVNSGTNVKVQEGQLKTGQFDEAIIRSNAAKTAYGHEVQALSAETSSQLDTMGAETSRTAGNISAASSILGTVGSVASKWYTAGSSFGTGGGSSVFFPSGSFVSSDIFMPSI